MPIFAALVFSLAGKAFALLALLQAQHWFVRIAIVTSLAVLYVACVATFSLVVAPLFGSIVNTSYGQVLGLAFPPVAGTVLAALLGFWACILAKRLTVRLLKAI